MSNTTTLFRAGGQAELDLIAASIQPFYPDFLSNQFFILYLTKPMV
jgi:hypothetical protein